VDRVLQNITEFGASFASYDVRPERFHEAGDHVVTVLHRSARSARSPAPIEDRFAQLFSLRDGRVVRIQSFRRVEDALEAAGST
jgi:ketosteroid isomerase-like protein